MNHYHKRNKANWNGFADKYKLRVDREDLWDKCHIDPTLALIPSEIEAFGDVTGKRIGVLGSGANLVTFALAGMGATVTSIDVSVGQLRHARTRAETLGLKAAYITSDVVSLGLLAESFDAIHTGGYVACWVSDLDSYYAEASRILEPGGVLVFRESHPFFREIWSPSNERLTVERLYGERGPYLEEGNEGDPYVFTWTVSDYVNAVLKAGFDLVRFEEIPPSPDMKNKWKDTQFYGLPDEILLVGRKR